MSKHMSLLADLKTMVETKKVAGSGVLLLDNYTDRIQVGSGSVQTSPLTLTVPPAGPTKHGPLCRPLQPHQASGALQQLGGEDHGGVLPAGRPREGEWLGHLANVRQIQCYYREVSGEQTELNLRKLRIQDVKPQVGFIDYIVHPLWETWADLVHPDAQEILDALENNRDWYQAQLPPSPSSSVERRTEVKDWNSVDEQVITLSN